MIAGRGEGGEDASYRQALERLAALARFGVRPGLETIGRLCARLGHPERRVPAVHVAGTNGKGSTAAFAASLLAAGGARVGLYTSPHLLRFTERIRVDGAEIGRGPCAELIERCFAGAEAEGIEPTFFEVATAAAFLAFAEAGLDVAVLECGLGGRLDATTVCAPVVSVITRIGLDHTEVLGDTVELIAAEKVGIARAGVPLVAGPLEPGPAAVIEARARELGLPLLRLGRELSATHRRGADEGGAAGLDLLDYDGPGGALHGAALGLPGAHQADNAALALAAVALTPRGRALDEAARRRGLREVRWPGRLERLAPDLRVDGAHNADGALALAASLGGEPRVTLLLGMLGDKDAAQVVAALLPVARHLVCTRAPSPRALPEEELAAVARRVAAVQGRPALPIEAVGPLPAALARARAVAATGTGGEAGGQVIGCGSLYLVGALRALLSGEAVDPAVVADPLGAGGHGAGPVAGPKLEGGPRRV